MLTVPNTILTSRNSHHNSHCMQRRLGGFDFHPQGYFDQLTVALVHELNQ